MSVYVGNISFEAIENNVNDIFSEYGSVMRVHLPTDRETGRMCGFGFVEMESEQAENAAIEALDQAFWMGRNLRVNKAQSRSR